LRVLLIIITIEHTRSFLHLIITVQNASDNQRVFRTTKPTVFNGDTAYMTQL